MVFSSGPEESDTSNVNLLDRTCEGAVRLLGLEDERVEVADDEGDGGDVVGSKVGEVGVNLAGQDA